MTEAGGRNVTDRGNGGGRTAPRRADGPPRSRPRADGRRVLHLVGNSHIDPVWLWQWPEGLQEVRATFRSALDRMNEYPEFIFTCDSAAYYQWVEEIDPEMFEEIRARVAEGRWELVGGWWIEPDCNLPSGESFVRQALISQRYFQEKFGQIATVGYNVDPFGHNGMLPQILRRSGMDAYVFMRPGPHEYRLPWPVFWWESPDGSRVLTFRLPHEYCAPREDLGYHLDKSIAQLPDEWTEMMAFYGVGNHGGGPTRENLESIRRLDASGAMPALRHSTPRRFFDSLRDSGQSFPVVREDLQHHAVGCYSAHSGIKRWNRRAENALASAEAWSAVATIAAGQAYPRSELERAWKQVLFNQFHDTLGGTAIEPAYRDARDQLGEAASIAARAQNTAIQSLSRRIHLPTDPSTVPIVVFNPHAWPVHETVELEYGGLKPTDGLRDDQGNPVAFQVVQSYATVSAWRSRIAFEADLPPLGYRTYRMTAASPSPAGPALRAENDLLENDHVRLELDPTTGRVRRLVLREDGRDVADLAEGDRPRAVVIEDTSDTWGHRKLAYRDEVGEFEAVSVSLVEAGPVRAIVRVESRWGDSTLVEDFVLAAGSAGIDVRVVLDWRERSRLLKLRYATRLAEPAATFEIPYGAIERPANGDEEPGQRWIDVSGRLPADGAADARAGGLRAEDDAADHVAGGGAAGAREFGLALLNDAKYGFDIHDGELGLTAVRSPIYAHHEPTIPRPGVRYQHQDLGQQRFSLRLVPHRGAWSDAGLTRRAAELNLRPAVLIESFHDGPLPLAGSYVSVSPEHLVLGAVKLAEDGDDLLVRVVETAGRAAAARVELPQWARTIEFQIEPFQIRTFRVPRDPSGDAIEVDLLERPLEPARTGTPRKERAPHSAPVGGRAGDAGA
jgi:alpha-mannosidase